MRRSAIALALLLPIGTACSSGSSSASNFDSAADIGPLERIKSFEIHEQPTTVAAFDINHDGHLDFVVGGPNITVVYGDGKLGFRTAPGMPLTGFEEAIDFGFGDFDGDGRTDIAFAEHDAPEPQFWVLRALADGSFEPGPGGPFVVDAIPHLHTLAVDDFNGDQLLDIVTDSWPESSLLFVAGKGDGTFQTPGDKFGVPEAPLQNLRAADLNGDGFSDIVTPAHDLSAVTVLLGDGRGRFEQVAGSPFRSHGGFSTLELGDVDRDGDPDVIEVHRSDSSTQYKVDALSVLLNDGDGKLSHAPGSPLTGLPERSYLLAIGDLNGDGWLDVATVGDSSGGVAIFHGGESGMKLIGAGRPIRRPRGLAVGDFDGDGSAEVLVTDFDEGLVVVLGAK